MSDYYIIDQKLSRVLEERGCTIQILPSSRQQVEDVYNILSFVRAELLARGVEASFDIADHQCPTAKESSTIRAAFPAVDKFDPKWKDGINPTYPVDF